MAELFDYKCPACGGALSFDSHIQKMKCPYCDSEYDMDTLKKMDEELNASKPDQMNWNTDAGSQWQDGEADSIRVYACNSCGGEIIGDVNTAATSCPFCGNPVVMKGNFTGNLRPDLVIPFKLDKKAAVEGLSSHVKNKKLLPKVFRDQNHLDEVKGVYIPFWLFDADAEAEVKYRATKIRRWSDVNYNYTETSYYSVMREGSLSFQHIPVDGSTKIDNTLMESLEPYDMSQAVDFQTAYLAGYLADKYDVPAADCVTLANERAKKTTEEAFRSTVMGYATVTPSSSSVSFHNGRVRYALLPVWLLHTSWQGNNYLFAMNGQTGKFIGDLPIDKGLQTKWYLLYSLLASAGVFAVLTTLAMFLR